jgi:FixJ family two-component response regulator
MKQVVLVVDDDPQMRESLESLLQSAELGVQAFASAEEVLQSPMLPGARCLVTDIRMPGMDGLELQRRLKRDHPNLPVILITGNYDDRDELKALSAGALVLLFKPFDPNDLLLIIQTAIQDATDLQ